MMFITVVIFFLIITISIVAFSLQIGISPMPSSQKVKKEITSFLLQNLPLQNFQSLSCGGCIKVYELGSGWGGLLFMLAKKFPNTFFQAFELSPLPWLVSFIVHKIVGYSNVKIARKNFFSSSLECADVILCYLYPGAMQNLKVKFEKELQIGTLVISNSFAIPGWVPEKIIFLEGLWKTEIFIYRVIPTPLLEVEWVYK